MAGICPLGQDWPSVRERLRSLTGGVRRMDEWDAIEGLQTRLGAPVTDFVVPDTFERRKIRTMGRVALLSARATELALREAKLLDHPALTDGSTGIAFGSTAGSPVAVEDYFEKIHVQRGVRGLSPNTYLQMMSHTCAANLGHFFGVKGRIVTTCSACTSGSQGIGYGYESIRDGRQLIMISGGAEELHVSDAITFDVLFATSTSNDRPDRSPRPFDKTRDGLVVGEGAGTLILEELDHARARGVPIHSEVVGYATNCDGEHITNPCRKGMERVMRMSLASAGLQPDQIQYVNAHGTATEVGDIAEGQATEQVFGRAVPISSLKGYMGHTLGACGALEAWITIQMMKEGWVCPTLNLTEPDERCGNLDFIRGSIREMPVTVAMSNNFAFGGVNTSLIFKRWEGM